MRFFALGFFVNVDQVIDVQRIYNGAFLCSLFCCVGRPGDLTNSGMEIQPRVYTCLSTCTQIFCWGGFSLHLSDTYIFVFLFFHYPVCHCILLFNPWYKIVNSVDLPLSFMELERLLHEYMMTPGFLGADRVGSDPPPLCIPQHILHFCLFVWLEQ